MGFFLLLDIIGDTDFSLLKIDFTISLDVVMIQSPTAGSFWLNVVCIPLQIER